MSIAAGDWVVPSDAAVHAPHGLLPDVQTASTTRRNSLAPPDATGAGGGVGAACPPAPRMQLACSHRHTWQRPLPVAAASTGSVGWQATRLGMAVRASPRSTARCCSQQHVRQTKQSTHARTRAAAEEQPRGGRVTAQGESGRGRGGRGWLVIGSGLRACILHGTNHLRCAHCKPFPGHHIQQICWTRVHCKSSTRHSQQICWTGNAPSGHPPNRHPHECVPERQKRAPARVPRPPPHALNKSGNSCGEGCAETRTTQNMMAALRRSALPVLPRTLPLEASYRSTPWPMQPTASASLAADHTALQSRVYRGLLGGRSVGGGGLRAPLDCACRHAGRACRQAGAGCCWRF